VRVANEVILSSGTHALHTDTEVIWGTSALPSPHYAQARQD